MANNPNPFDPLFDRVVQYGTTSIEIFKLQTIAKSADVSSSLLSRLLLLFVIALSVISLNIALGFWIGQLVGTLYVGFLIVAAFYAVVSGLLLLLHSAIKSRVYESIVRQMLN
jgi:hypothetical protein